jgi:hypothetical protein
MDISRTDGAIVYAHRATQIEPGAADLLANLALAYVLAGQLENARGTITKSLTADPSDTISKTIQLIIQHFESNGRTPPKTAPELQSYWLKNRSDSKRRQ